MVCANTGTSSLLDEILHNLPKYFNPRGLNGQDKSANPGTSLYPFIGYLLYHWIDFIQI